MKKKVLKSILLIVVIIIAILAVYNAYKWYVCGEQYIRTSIPTTVYTNSDLYVSFIVQKGGTAIETKTKVKLLDSNGKKVKDVEVSYDGDNVILSIPDIEAGTYTIQAKVSSSEGRDTIEKEIYISEGNDENVTISLDKGIYKPGDTVNFRALLTSKDNDEPVEKDVTVSIYDGNDNKVYVENTTSSDYGILSGSFTLADEVNSGTYKLIVTTDSNETTKQFKVNPYVTPKYEVNISYDKDSYLLGDTVQINIDSEYFFGEAVSNAQYVVYINDAEYKTITADSNGNAVIKYQPAEAGTYALKVEAVDSSNYYIEETSSFTVGTDIFEIELLPEYGELVANKKNDVYIFTSEADGTPVKTYVTVSTDDFTKQIATDENGIGSFSIDIDSVRSYSNSELIFDVVAENMDGEKVEKEIEIDVKSKSILLSTDKVKYEQGDDINIEVTSTNENTNNIYFLKNGEIIKMITTDSDEVTANLEDTYGLIDIYITNGKSSSGSYSTSYKRTIFINPDKELNIDISTDKDEYTPGENISISFNTTDENDSNVDAALLVSMIDNAVLSLADNDLSIDNIKLALSDIKFTDELDAATLYSCLINDSSEQTLMALLLKQSGTDPSVSESIAYNYDDEETAAIITMILIPILVIIGITFYCVKFKKFRDFMKHTANLVVFETYIVILFAYICEVFFYRVFDYDWWTLIVSMIIGLAIYIIGLSRIKEQTYKTSIIIIFTYLLLITFFMVVETFEELGLIIFITTLAVILLILISITRLNEIKTLKGDKYIRKLSRALLRVAKFIGAIIIVVIAITILTAISDAIFSNKITYIIDNILIVLAIVPIYYLNYKFNKPRKKKKAKEEKAEEKNLEEENPEELKISGKGWIIVGVIIALACIGIIAIGIFIYNLGSGVVSDGDIDSSSSSSSSSGGIEPSTWSADTSTSNSSSFKGSSILEDIIDVADSLTSSGIVTDNDMGDVVIAESDTDVTSDAETTEATTDDVRDVFLESMCFIPELITSDGSADLDLTLSDNITTWTIQTVGNTKDGRIGYSVLNDVKVFKEYFVDFELPNNLVETDTVSIPVTVYNYTDNALTANLKIEDQDWFTLNTSSEMTVEVPAQSSQMVYVSITIIESGSNKFRVETTSGDLSDIVEKTAEVEPNGYKVEKVVSTGTLSEDISEDILVLEDIVENTASATVKIYSSATAQAIEGMENIFKMPTGCFEQVSSSLYPDILALKYLEDNGIVDEEIRSKALSYISSGYQKLLTYEVSGESGGYSLYGKSPAETVLTAYGLMELTDLSEVYSVDENVIDEMTEYLYGKQNSNGSFEITGSHMGGATSKETISLNAYIIWALSESNPNDSRLEKSVEYLKDEIEDIEDNYTLALIANVLANVDDKEVDDVIKILVNNINSDGSVSSNMKDYYGSSTTIQTTALTSMALSKTAYNVNTNKNLINYLISKKDSRGTWSTTQSTILVLKAINELNENNKLTNQTITVKVNSDEQKIEIGDSAIDIYQVTFENLSKENKLNIDIESGEAYYEVIEEYYVPYDSIDLSEDEIEVTVSANQELSVNEILTANIRTINTSDDDIYNGMVTISIPQGFTVVEDSLMLLETEGLIEKYETSYTTVNLYIRDFEVSQILDLAIQFRASYPVDITGLSVRVYDYYNPEVEGRTMPIAIKVNE